MVVLTPAEEQGLSGLQLDGRVRKAFYAMSPEAIVELSRRMTEQSAARHLLYLRDGQPEVIRIMLRPIAVMPDQLAYLNFVSLSILNALKRLPDLYLQDFAVREIVPLSAREEKWLWDNWGPSHRENNPVLGRLDAVAEFTSPMWKDSLRFMEPNLCGVGGLHMGPTCEQLLADIVLPAIQQYDAGLQMEVGQDLREIFIQEVFDHLQAIGRSGQNICFVEPKYAGQGPDEQEALAQYYHDRHGLKIMHADPRELSISDGEARYEGNVVDIAYRDYEVRDLIQLETEEDVDVEPIRLLFRENRMISSMAGDFDHKSCWELLTDQTFVNKYFTAEERQIFRRHVLWTRVLGDRTTILPDGDQGDLLEFVRKQHDLLVLKPNRSYGGDRVVIGHLIDQAEWERSINTALADSDKWVVQRLASLPVHEFSRGWARRQRAHRAVLYRNGLRPQQIWVGNPRPRIAKTSGQCGSAAWRHVPWRPLSARPAGRLAGPTAARLNRSPLNSPRTRSWIDDRPTDGGRKGDIEHQCKRRPANRWPGNATYRGQARRRRFSRNITGRPLSAVRQNPPQSHLIEQDAQRRQRQAGGQNDGPRLMRRRFERLIILHDREAQRIVETVQQHWREQGPGGDKNSLQHKAHRHYTHRLGRINVYQTKHQRAQECTVEDSITGQQTAPKESAKKDLLTHGWQHAANEHDEQVGPGSQFGILFIFQRRQHLGRPGANLGGNDRHWQNRQQHQQGMINS